MRIVLARPASDDVIALLQAWRFWLLAGLLGALLGGAAYAVVPPPFRAAATVNVDFHLEQAWPQNTDREQFYYLERETRKLIEIAASDDVMEAVAAAVPPTSVEQLRSGLLHLSQPGNGGWHFYAYHRDSDAAKALASAWAEAFADEVRGQISTSSPSGLESYITADVTQSSNIVAAPSPSSGWYVLVGAGVALTLAALIVLFIRVNG